MLDAGNEGLKKRLRAVAAAEVTLPELALDIILEAGEEILTEISAKFRREGLERELANAGYSLVSWWADPKGLFALSLARAH